ncbi:hypothetical protein HD806DRAFT_552731 [Xylariaceae sp. AK1471]|nr:hypothetical protein HD806DRAFT_552731 [Xylariaceae sp. AK1471]
MRRQQQFQGMSSKRHCPPREFTMNSQGNQQQLNNQWLYNSGGQLWGHTPMPQQPAQQQSYTNTYLQPDFMFCNYNNIQAVPSNLNNTTVPASFDENTTVPEPTHFNINPGLTFGLDTIINPSPNLNTFLEGWPDDFMMQNELNESGFPPIPEPDQRPEQLEINQQLWPNLECDLLEIATIGPPIGINMIPSPQPIGRNIPAVPPFHSREPFAYRPHLPGHKKNGATIPPPRDRSNVDILDIVRSPPPPVISSYEIIIPLIPPEGQNQHAPKPRAKPDGEIRPPDTTIPNLPSPTLDVEMYEPAPGGSLASQFGLLVGYTYADKEDQNQAIRGINEEINHDAQAQAKEALRVREQEAQQRQPANNFEWLGDPSEYPAECYEDLQLPGCQFRRRAICVGRPRDEWFRQRGQAKREGRVVVYAVPRPDKNGVEFRLKEVGSSVEEVEQNETVGFRDIELNSKFSGMDEHMVVRWSGTLLAEVPGMNNSMTMWS